MAILLANAGSTWPAPSRGLGLLVNAGLPACAHAALEWHERDRVGNLSEAAPPCRPAARCRDRATAKAGIAAKRQDGGHCDC